MNTEALREYWRIGIGGAIVLILLVSNIIVLLSGDDFIRSGERNLPPKSLLLQRVTMQFPLHEEVYDPWGMLIMSDEDAEDEIFVRNRPNVRATIGQAYTFRPKLKNGAKAEQLEAGRVPAGASVEEGRFVWKPDSLQAGRHEIELRITIRHMDESTTKMVTFPVYVSSEAFFLGTDERGRSMVHLLISGTKWLVLPGLIALLIALPVGLLLGALSGFYTGMASKILQGLNLLLETVPALLLIFLAAVISGFNIYSTMIAAGLVLMPAFAESIRAVVQRFREIQFVESAVELGLSPKVVLWREIIWVNCKGLIFPYIPYVFAFAVMVEVTLSYLGIGVQIPETSWGLVLNSGRAALLDGMYWVTLFPGLAIVLTIFGFYVLGDGIARKCQHK
ncbi:ABC-type dipeptide/oligopeptide/nickel transport system, permease component [Cyclonatronum proteinivorum]|uniref:ABC-type dipeptide/oligopeptide/nickel transport system, permease component n=1 Tax=Cyclonatronum proteinivorum TaxID=1457365 RepID=A0A345UHJ9_9BACT|nr:ABC transporter permease [Cyclonatronum proteinivorum]AXI99950.1 ABC-type dipeptide/oligopeptide/nickel transport system, permease component [Cyclonatronum proteinivorum]